MKCYINICFLLISFTCWGQQDSIDIETIEISSSRWTASHVGAVVQNISEEGDLITLGDHAGKALTQFGIHIKSNGPSTLSTISVRGGNAQQTLLLWNEIPIKSPMNGVVDFSLVPVSLFNKIESIRGGNSGIWGSGAVGGIIKLSEQPVFNHKEVSIEGGLGSFDNYAGALSYNYGTKQVSLAGSVRYVNHLNAFSFKAIPSAPREVMRNAHAEGLDLKQDITLLRGKTTFSLKGWSQRYNREIPRTTVQKSTASYQEDVANRFQFNIKHYLDAWTFSATGGYLTEDILYWTDRLNSGPEESGYTSWIGLGSIERKWNDHFSTTLNTLYDFTTAYAKGYHEKIIEVTKSVALHQRFTYNKLTLAGTVRYEQLDDKSHPLTPQLAMAYQLTSSWRIGGKVGYNYRYPTLNDRYWTPGGSRKLKPESGWGVEVNSQVNREDFSWSAALYHRYINNWIMWVPGNNRNIWSPENITSVWSRGIETDLSYTTGYGPWEFIWKLGGNINASTAQEAVALPSIEEGDQILYTPRYQYRSGVQLNYGKASLHYLHRWMAGSIGVNEDPTAYDLGHMSVGLRLHKIMPVELRLIVDNIGDQWYQVVERRPMPGRSIILNFKLTI